MARGTGESTRDVRRVRVVRLRVREEAAIARWIRARAVAVAGPARLHSLRLRMAFRARRCAGGSRRRIMAAAAVIGVVRIGEGSIETRAKKLRVISRRAR